MLHDAVDTVLVGATSSDIRKRRSPEIVKRGRTALLSRALDGAAADTTPHDGEFCRVFDPSGGGLQRACE